MIFSILPNIKLRHLVYLDFFSNGVMRAMFMFAQPFITVYMISTADPIYYKISLLISTGAGIITGMMINKERILFFRKVFIILCIVDSISLCLINYYFGHNPNFRFIAIALSESFTVYFISTILNDFYNNIFNNSTITVVFSRMQAWQAAGAIIGFGLSIIFELTVDQAIILSSFSVVFDNVCSIFLRSKLTRYIDKHKARPITN